MLSTTVAAVPSPSAWWAAWDHLPMVAFAALCAAGLYLRGVERLWRKAGRGRAVRPTQLVAFGVGLAALVIAFGSPLAALAHELLALHMVQHLLVLLVAPPLLALSRPGLPLLWGLGPRARRFTRRLPRVRGRGPATALVAWFAAGGTLWLWHAPGLYEVALRHEAVHLVEHASLLATAWMYWWSVLGLHRSPRGAGLGVLSLFGTMLVGGGLGALLTFARTPWYDSHTISGALWALSPLEDQQLAGVLMWIPGGLLYLGAALALFVRWLAGVERRGVTADMVGAHRSGRLPSALGWTVVAVALVAACGSSRTDDTLVAGADENAGRSALRDYGCVACHQVPGVAGPQGNVGPPLGSLADRRIIAGRLPHTRENLARWIQDPQDVDPETVMPDLDVTDEDVRNIIGYLYTLD